MKKMPKNTTQKISLSASVTDELSDKRLDQVASVLFSQYSRTRLQSWIKNGELTVDDKILRSKDKVQAGQVILVNATLKSEGNGQAQDIKLDIVYEDQDIIVINKPVGLVTHPAIGNRDNTLLNALLYHAPELKNVPRAGIVHRLDKDTSGLLVVARNLEAHTHLTRELKNHEIEREYEAIVDGAMIAGGTIDKPIGRHPYKRTLMAVTENGREAVTHYRVLERFPAHTHLKVQLETGRTHQIRVHLAHIGYPIVGDKTYGGRFKLPPGATEKLKEALRNFPRQALHARSLTLEHPRTGNEVTFAAPLPKDMRDLLKLLRST